MYLCIWLHHKSECGEGRRDILPLQGDLVADKVLSVPDFSWPEANTRFLEGELHEEKSHTHHAGMGQCTQTKHDTHTHTHMHTLSGQEMWQDK